MALSEHEELEQLIVVAQQPIVADLRAVGFEVTSPLGLLRDPATDWSLALSVLSKHLTRDGYPDLLMYRVARMFGRPEGLLYWAQLERMFLEPRGPSEQSASAHALATMATPQKYPDLVRLLHHEGAEGRSAFIEPIAKMGGDESVEIISEFKDQYSYYVDRALRRRKESTARPGRHARASRRLNEAVSARVDPEFDVEPVEWSTSLDLSDWKRFAKHLRARLGGELDEPLGQALFETISSAPENDEQHVKVKTALGVVRLGWYISDLDVVDVFVFGSAGVQECCDEIIKKHFPDR